MTLRDFLRIVDEKALLKEVKEEVEREELPQLIEDLSKEGKVLVFQNVKGYKTKVVANLLPSEEVWTIFFGERPGEEFLKRVEKRGEKVSSQKGIKEEYEEVEVKELLEILPILHHYEEDSAPYITTGVASSWDPQKKVVGRGVYRMEYRGGNQLGIALLNPPLKDTLELYRRKEEDMPIVITIGHHPLVFLAMALKVPEEIDKLQVASSLLGREVEVIPSPSFPQIDVPFGCEVILEGSVDPKDQRKDGPLGEVSGFYHTLEKSPTIRIKKAFLKRPFYFYHALLPTGSEADTHLTFVSKAFLEKKLKEVFPFVTNIKFIKKTFGSSVLIQVKEVKERSLITNLILFVLSNPMIKKCIVVDDDVNLSELEDIEWAIITRCWADEDVIIVSHSKAQQIDPEAKRGYSSKIGINAVKREDIKRAIIKRKGARNGTFS
jgi:2,5-furandicarboxylate decarboxylase 1